MKYAFLVYSKNTYYVSGYKSNYQELFFSKKNVLGSYTTGTYTFELYILEAMFKSF